ncbi:MAG: hypothetical protein ACI4QI_06665 [Candidatus Coproplasma sp.]
MQLAILLAVLLMAGQNNFTQIKPLIEELGGEEGKQAIKQAEELNQLIATVRTFTEPKESGDRSDINPQNTEVHAAELHPLDPVKGIADDKILSALSRYVALGE